MLTVFNSNLTIFPLFPVEELITLVENVADSVSIGQCNPDSMALLLSNLRILGPQLEEYSNSTLDQGMFCSVKIDFQSKLKDFVVSLLIQRFNTPFQHT